MRTLDAAIVVCITIDQIVEDAYSIAANGLYEEIKYSVKGKICFRRQYEIFKFS